LKATRSLSNEGKLEHEFASIKGLWAIGELMAKNLNKALKQKNFII